jgi:hypothetical protein
MACVFNLGNDDLLVDRINAIFCSTRAIGTQINTSYAWAREQCDLGSTVISGFHTPVERDVYDILSRRGAKIIHCLARSLPKRLSTHQQMLISEGRLLILTPFSPRIKRATRKTASERNRFIAKMASKIFVGSMDAESALKKDLEGFEYEMILQDS